MHLTHTAQRDFLLRPLRTGFHRAGWCCQPSRCLSRPRITCRELLAPSGANRPCLGPKALNGAARRQRDALPGTPAAGRRSRDERPFPAFLAPLSSAPRRAQSASIVYPTDPSPVALHSRRVAPLILAPDLVAGEPLVLEILSKDN